MSSSVFVLGLEQLLYSLVSMISSWVRLLENSSILRTKSAAISTELYS